MKNESQILKKENELLNKENQKLRKENEILKKKFVKLNQEIKNIEKKYKILNKEKLTIIINDLKSILNNNDDGTKKYNNLLDEEKFIAINFISTDQCINHTIICEIKMEFHNIEAQLYAEYPEYRNGDNFFMFNGIRINRWKTLEENGMNGNNGIQDYKIILKKIDDSSILSKKYLNK